VQADAQRVLTLEGEIGRRFRYLLSRKFSALRLRCHGDYNLGEILYTGKDFMIIDLEGLPSRSWPIAASSARRCATWRAWCAPSITRRAAPCWRLAPLAAGAPGVVRPEDLSHPGAVAWTWHRWVAATFLKA